MSIETKNMINQANQAAVEAWNETNETQGCCGGAPAAMQSQGCGCHAPAPAQSNDVWEDKLKAAIDKVRPFLQMDGGDMELLAIEDNNAIIRLTGACNGCPSAAMHMKQGVEQAIKKELPDFGELVTVEL